jgi:trk system potassium uptake protein TrkA
MADKIAKSLVSPNVLDYIPLADDYMICEIAPPSGFIGKTLAEIQLRSKYHVDVIAVRDMLTEKIHMVPAANFVVKDSEVLIVVGKEVDVDKIK